MKTSAKSTEHSAVILASASPRRRQILKALHIPFALKPSHVDETTHLKKPHAIVKELALRKARSVAGEVPRGIVIGADTIVVYKNEIIGKPADPAHAEEILSKLNGSYHRVYSGVAVIDAATGKAVVDYEISRVKMRKLSPQEIATFSHKHLDKAGAYAVQETDDAFVEKIEGDYYNVVGLPVRLLQKLLKKFGISVDVSLLD